MKTNCLQHGLQSLVPLGEDQLMCSLCYNHMLRTGDSESATIVDARPRIFEEAARLWEEMELPVFEVKGWMDGRDMKWNIPGVLREAAKRLAGHKQKQAIPERPDDWDGSNPLG